MNFLANESVDQSAVERLRSDGHDVLAVAEMAPSLPDEAVLAMANQREAILLTADKDFGELVFRQHRISAGVVLVRLAGLLPTTKASVVSSVIGTHESELLHAFTVVSPGLARYFPQACQHISNRGQRCLAGQAGFCPIRLLLGSGSRNSCLRECTEPSQPGKR